MYTIIPNTFEWWIVARFCSTLHYIIGHLAYISKTPRHHQIEKKNGSEVRWQESE
jgi:hypothetical protein